jgi:hypothetical protein
MDHRMKRILLVSAIGLMAVCGLVGYCTDSNAQQPEDPRIAGYRQLLTEANERVVLYAGQAAQLAAENTALKAELAKQAKPSAPDKPQAPEKK